MLKELAGNEDGILQLLDCESYDESVTGVKRLFIHPKQDLTIVMDRHTGTRHLGIAAGYYILQKDRMIRTVDIPIVYSRNNRSARPGKLNLSVNLGSEQIAATQVR